MRIGIIGAMDEEIERYLEGMQVEEKMNKSSVYYYQGNLAGQNVILCKSGVGKVNAAITTQILIDYFQVDKIIFTGVAGALDPELEIGDIVVSSDAQYHDMDVTPLGFDRGIIPFSDISIFDADKHLIELALEASRESTGGKTIEGRVLSGDQFIANRETVEQLHTLFKGACTEMEGAAVAHVCSKNQVSFVIVRSMSDRADGSAHVNFAEFTKMAAERSFQIIHKMLLLL